MISGRSRAADRNGQRFDDALVSLVGDGCGWHLRAAATSSCIIAACGGVVCVLKKKDKKRGFLYDDPMLCLWYNAIPVVKWLRIVMLCPCLHAMSMVIAMMI